MGGAVHHCPQGRDTRPDLEAILCVHQEADPAESWGERMEMESISHGRLTLVVAFLPTNEQFPLPPLFSVHSPGAKACVPSEIA